MWLFQYSCWRSPSRVINFPAQPFSNSKSHVSLRQVSFPGPDAPITHIDRFTDEEKQHFRAIQNMIQCMQLWFLTRLCLMARGTICCQKAAKCKTRWAVGSRKSKGSWSSRKRSKVLQTIGNGHWPISSWSPFSDLYEWPAGTKPMSKWSMRSMATWEYELGRH